MKKRLGILLVLGMFLMTACSVETEHLVKNEVIEEVEEVLSSVEPIYLEIEERDTGKWMTWSPQEGDFWYEVYVKRRGKPWESFVKTSETALMPILGERALYQVTAYNRKGEEISERKSQIFEFAHIISGEKGGMIPWKRPDLFDSYRSANAFPKGLYWDPFIGEEVKNWLVDMYSENYLLGGHIAEKDKKTQVWRAPITPSDRVNPLGTGNGLDCVGFVNGFYYAYTMAASGENYHITDVPMEHSHGVYGTEFTPLGYTGFLEDYVLKPVLKGTYADVHHIRAGDINESDDHVWIVSGEGRGLDSYLWEYDYLGGFSDKRTLRDIEKEHIRHPYEYWITGIGNPLESYSTLKVLAVSEEGTPIEGGKYQLIDTYGRVLAIEEGNEAYQLFRPKGEEFFFQLFTARGESPDFYRENSFFRVPIEGATLERVIGGVYGIKEVARPVGHKGVETLWVEVSPGEEVLVTLVYQETH